MKIILASQSPRRFELLAALGHEVRVIAPGIEELEDGLLPHELALVNARNKALHIYTNYGHEDAELIIAADTIVVLAGRIFGKPKDLVDAQNMISALSGHTHQVITAFCLVRTSGQSICRTVSSEITMRCLSKYEITAYLKTKESLDKSGSYAVQGAGAALISKINGSISNIIGLPIEELLEEASRLLIPSPSV